MKARVQPLARRVRNVLARTPKSLRVSDRHTPFTHSELHSEVLCVPELESRCIGPPNKKRLLGLVFSKKYRS